MLQRACCDWPVAIENRSHFIDWLSAQKQKQFHLPEENSTIHTFKITMFKLTLHNKTNFFCSLVLNFSFVHEKFFFSRTKWECYTSFLKVLPKFQVAYRANVVLKCVDCCCCETYTNPY